MKKILLIAILLITLGSCKLRTETVVIKFLDNSVDTVTLRYRGKLSLTLRRDLVDGVGDTKAMNVKDFSIIKR